MLGRLKQFFDKRANDGSGSPSSRSTDDILVAVCALFVEMARIDDAFTVEEMETIIEMLIDQYALPRENAQDIVAAAGKALKESVDLWQFARQINENYTISDKLDLVDMLWRMVYLDGHMDAHEHYLMGKLKNLLRLDQDQLIASKLKIKAELSDNSTGA